MQVAGEFLFKGSLEQVWAQLNDAAALQRCLPGCESLVQTGEDQYRATLKMGLAAVKGSYDGTLAITDKQPPTTITIKIDASGSTGFVNVGGRMDLQAVGPDTKVTYNWDVAVGGPVAMVGQRVLGGVAKWIIGEFFGAAQKELAQKGGAA